MSLLAAAALGVVQGLTEFLPVSSSAHLILARAFFGWDAGAFGLAFDVACHVGTLVAVLAFFRADLAALVRAGPRVLGAPDADVRRLRFIAAGTVPIVLLGGLARGWIDGTLRTPVVAAVALVLGAGLLLVVERLGARGRGEEALTLGGALVIGVAQAAALVPGVSRSGATIATGMLLGLRREAAARFAFLMSVPAVAAAAVEEAFDVPRLALGAGDVAALGMGLATSAVVGYLTVKYFLRFLATHRLDVFAWYRIGLAAVTFGWLAR